jgi:hypothetical protein
MAFQAGPAPDAHPVLMPVRFRATSARSRDLIGGLPPPGRERFVQLPG